jgi:hypothetical protein
MAANYRSTFAFPVPFVGMIVFPLNPCTPTLPHSEWLEQSGKNANCQRPPTRSSCNFRFRAFQVLPERLQSPVMDWW